MRVIFGLVGLMGTLGTIGFASAGRTQPARSTCLASSAQPSATSASIVGDVPAAGACATTATAPIVPQPVEWAMFVAGFGLVGSVARTRQHRPLIYR